jgi:hypothetical protein
MFNNYHTNENGESLNLMVAPLGDLTAGSYTFNITTVNGALDMAVVDSEGEDYPITEAPAGVFTLTLSDDVDRIFLVGDTVANNVTMSYEVNNASLVSGVIPSTTARSLASAVEMDLDLCGVLLFACVIALVYKRSMIDFC